MKAMLRIFGALVILVVLFVVIHPSVVRGQNGDQNSNAVTTQGYDNNRDNVNSAETVFLATNFSFAQNGEPHISTVNGLHGIVYAQPLYLPQIPYRLNADLLYVATEENWIYAMDANNMPITTSNTWSDDFNQINCPYPCTGGGDTIFGPVPDANLSDGVGCTNIQPEVGITGTPVIDFSSSSVPDVIYAVSDHWDTSQQKVRQFLNAVSVKDGSPVAPSIDIAAKLLSTLGVSFDASAENQRAGLALTHDSNGNPYIYVAWAGYCDNYNPPGGNPTQYTGLVAVFEVTSSPTTLTPVAVFNDEAASMGQQAGIWMGGAGPAIDDVSSGGSGDVYISTGNGLVTNPSYNIPLNTSANNLGMSILQLSLGSNTLAPVGAYTANEWSVLNCGSGMGPTCSNPPVCKNVLHLPYYPTLGVNPTFCSLGDFDLDAGGLILARPAGVALPGNDNFVVLAGGKEGVFYDLDPNNMSNTKPDTARPCTEQYGNGNGSYQTIQCFAGVLLQNVNKNSQQWPDSVGSRCSPAFWAGSGPLYKEDTLYLAGSDDSDIWAYQMDLKPNPPYFPAGSFMPVAIGSAPTPSQFGGNNNNLFPYPGICPVVTWNQNGTNQPDLNAVLWIMGPVKGGTQQLYNMPSPTGAQPVVITAYHALPTLGKLNSLNWTDNTNGPGAVQFTEPTVVNGHVYAAGESVSKNNYQNVSGLCGVVGQCYGAVTVWY